MGDLSPLFPKILDCPQPEDSIIFPIEVAISLSLKIGENWGIPIFPQLSPKAVYSKKVSIFSFFQTTFWISMTTSKHILLFLLSKRVKKVYGTIKDHKKWNDICLILGKTGIPQSSPKLLPLSPPQTWGILGNLSPKIPKSLVLTVPKFSPKILETLSPSSPCPQTLGMGKGIFEFQGPTWTP